MARTKRKINPLAPIVEAVKAEPAAVTYHTAAYVRLSVEDSGKKGADTIEGQKKLLTDYISRHSDLELCGVWCDNGETGTNFARPQFEAMMEKVRGGEVNCIVVKDLSRFGRNYKETGNYLERIFPFLGVRFIAVNDNFDTLTAERSEHGYIVPLKNIINEAYSKDISKKVYSAFRAKQERGEFMTTWAPYGYSKDPTDKHRLVVNEETAPILKQIFSWRAAGMAVSWIGKQLNESGVLSPSAYLYRTGQSKVEKYRNAPWYQITLKRILANPVYLGHTVQGRRHQSFAEGMKETYMPESAWIIVENTHEPLVEQEVYDAVQRLSQERKAAYYKELGKYDYMGEHENIFKGLIYCADCGCPLTCSKHVYNNMRYYTFLCPVHGRTPDRCRSYKNIREDKLTEVVLAAIQKQTALAADMESVVRTINTSPTFCREVAQSKKRLTAAKATLTRCQSLYDSLYQNYVEKLMTEEEYIALRTRYRQQAEEDQRVISTLEQEELDRKQYTPENLFLQAFTSFQSCEVLTREMLTALIERIEIDGNDGVTIQFRYRDEFQALTAFIEGRDKK